MELVTYFDGIRFQMNLYVSFAQVNPRAPFHSPPAAIFALLYIRSQKFVCFIIFMIVLKTRIKNKRQ